MVAESVSWTPYCFLTDYQKCEVHRLRNIDLLCSLALKRLSCAETVPGSSVCS